jgi:hypothetical protein
VAAFHAKGTVDLLVDSNTFARLDGNAVLIEGFNRGATLQVRLAPFVSFHIPPPSPPFSYS